MNIYSQNTEYTQMFINEEYNELLAALDSKPDSTWHASEYMMKSMVLDKQGKKTEATNVLQKGITKYPNDSTLTLKFAGLLYETGDYTSALPVLKTAINVFPEKFLPAWQLAQIHIFSRNYHDAIQIMLPWHKRDNSNFACLTTLLECYSKTDSLDQAIHYAENTLNLSPGNQKIAFQLCNLHIRNDDFVSAIEVCDKVLERDQNNILFLQQKGNALLGTEKYDDAAKLYDLLIALHDSTLITLKNHGIANYKCKNYQKAVQSLVIVFDRNPNDYGACYFIANSLSKIAGEQKKALFYYDKALELLNTDESTATILKNKGDVYADLKDFKNAERYYKQSLTKNPSHTSNLYSLATLNDYHINNKKTALSFYKKYIEAIKNDELPQDSASQYFQSREEAIKFSVQRIKQLNEELFFTHEN
jgi:tetratricopeptide (TPR) repeat protein